MIKILKKDEVGGWNWLRNVFAQGGRVYPEHMTHHEHTERLSSDGAKRFKRKALGVCGHERVVSLDDFAEILVNAEIASSIEEAKSLVPGIVEAYVIKYNGQSLTFVGVSNLVGDTRYKISHYNFG